MLRTLNVLLSSLGLAIRLLAQSDASGPLVYPEKVRVDVDMVRNLVHQAHPDPYRYCTRTELDRMFDEVRDSIVVPITTTEFMERLQPVFHRIGDSRAILELDAPTQERMARALQLLPLKVRVLEGALYVDEELKGFRSLPLGSRILAINGVSATKILEGIAPLVVTDGANETLRWKLVERDFPMYFLRAFGCSASYVVKVGTPQGEILSETLFALTGEEIERSRKPATSSLHPWHSTWEAESATLWATFSALDRDVLDASSQNAERFLSGMLRELETNEARTLVIDLRGADGQELGMAELIFAMIAKTPFRVVQGMTVRGSVPPDALASTETLSEHYAFVADNYLPDANGIASLRPDDHRLEVVEPNKHAFQGKVYVVADGGTRGAAAALVMLAKRHGRARIVGEETGSNAYSFTGGRELQVTAPNTGLRIRVSLLRYIPDGMATGPLDHGELPHHPAQQEPWGIVKGSDTVRKALLEMIKELQ